MQFTPFPLFPQERRVMKESSRKLHFKCLKACLFPSGCKEGGKAALQSKDNRSSLYQDKIPVIISHDGVLCDY